MTKGKDSLDALVERYEECDETYLKAVRERRGEDLGTLAHAAAEAADAWQSEAYRRFFAERAVKGGGHPDVITLEIGAEKAEVLTDLWRDLATAHAEAAGPRNGSA